MTKIEDILKLAEHIGKEPEKAQSQKTINIVKLGMRVAIAECQKWYNAEEVTPDASENKDDWWISDIGEVYPYSELCIVLLKNGEKEVDSYSIKDRMWEAYGKEVVKWRYLEIK